MIQVTAGFLEKNGKLLIAQRRRGDLLEFKWELPGGKIEESETPESCLKRELLEEFGINTEILEFFGSSEFEYEHEKILLLAFKVKYISGEFNPSLHEKIKWVSPENLQNYDFAEADKSLIKKYLKEKHVISF
jgi:8-oxo-dGTP diphosphatase